MVTMVVTPELLDYQEFHRWLDANEPSWTWKIPERQAGGALSTTNDLEGLEWAIENIIKLAAFRGGQPPMRVHYRFKTRERAMLAKLTWGHMRPYGMGTSA